MKKMMTIGALVALIALPTAAGAQTGYYGWSISASPSVSTDNNPAPPPAGVVILYLWYTGGCHPGNPGLAAVEFDLTTGGTDWSVLAFTAANGFLNAGGATNLLLATPCRSTPIVAGNITTLATANPGRVGLTISANNKAAGVDCVTFTEWRWPEYMRFTGYATNNGTAPQDHGADCTTTSVENESWGAVKALYR